MNILITALGSMSAEHVITVLRRNQHRVIGCDIYPAHWIYSSRLVDSFCQVPRATDEQNYIEAINSLCLTHQIDIIIPLTDVEIDVLSKHRDALCIPHSSGLMSANAIRLSRDKLLLNEHFESTASVMTIPTERLDRYQAGRWIPPFISKPRNGRSSEGLRILKSEDDVIHECASNDAKTRIVQPQLPGDIYVIDIVRQAATGQWAAVARKELTRTANGAGISVEIVNNDALLDIAAEVARQIDVNGCINMEFISWQDEFYLMDINPRFSAGVEFSALTGYDMVTNHIRCFMQQPIDVQLAYQSAFFTRHYIAVQTG